MDLNQLLQKIPKPLLAVIVLAISIALFVYNDPLRDRCEVESALYKKKMAGILYATKINGKIQYPKINYWRENCKEGNSEGSCREYLEGLRLMVRELKTMSPQCQMHFNLNNDNFLPQISSALQILALIAWGEEPPAGLAERAGWLNVSQLQTFCYLKSLFLQIADEESYLALRAKIYREYPDKWPETIPLDERAPESRPRAFKTNMNPTGSLKESDVYQRSLFSLRCDSYM